MKKEIEFIDLDVDEIIYTEDVESEQISHTDDKEQDGEYTEDGEYYEEEAEYEDDEEYEEEAEYEDDEEYEEEAEYENDEEYEEEAEYEDDEEYEEDAEYEDDGEYYEEDDEYEDDEEYYEEDDEYEEDEDGEYEDDGSIRTRKKAKKKGKILNFKSHASGKGRSAGKRKEKKKPDRRDTLGSDRRDREKTPQDKIKAFFRDFNAIDAIVAGTGVFVLVVAVATMVLWGNSKDIAKQVTSMAEVGQKLSSLEVIGESSLLAIADAKKAFGTVQEEVPSTEEAEEPKGDREVTVNLTSVEKDLKIKFVGKDTKKLISGTEFEVELTGPDKKTKTVTDDDKDGIIYMTKMTPGTYSVKILPKDGYLFPTEATSVKVKDKIAYQKIEILDEVKSESEVNVAKEDTAVPVVQESALKDTVEYVESSKTPIDGTAEYQEIDKSKITDPSSSSKAGGYAKFADVELTVGGTQGVSAGSPTGAANFNWSSGNPGVAEVNGSGESATITAKSEGDATITVTWDNPTVSDSGLDPSGSRTFSVKVTAKTIPATGLSLNTTSAALTAGDSLTLTAKLTPADTTDALGAVSYKSSADNIATVDGSGKVTAVAAGTATITAAANSFSAICTVTVSAKNIAATGVTVEPSSKTLNAGETFQLKANVSPAGCTDAVKWESSNAAVASVDGSGKVTAAGKGTANITVTVGGYQAVCAVTVNSTLKVTLDKTGVEIIRKNKVALKPTASGFAAAPVYTWSTSDAKIATVDTGGTVTAVAKGKAKITVTAKDSDGKTAAAVCEITVKVGKEDDKTTKLKDNDGNQLYVQENGSYREAVYADYYTAKKFYKRNAVGYQYTGWQTIDNKTYYFDKNGNKVTGTQVIRGVQYTFGADGAIAVGDGTLGIDVSKHNGTINWAAVKNSGVSYAIIRCGYRGSTTGALIQDPKFQANIKGAQAAGIKVGVYFFTQAVNEVEAVEEASMVLNLIKGNTISYPVFIDTEGSGGRADGLDVGTRTAVCNAFSATIQNSGYKAGIYASKSWFEKKLNTPSLNQYKIWMAQYAAKPTYGGRYDLWQYSSKGAIGGISGNVDLNVSYLGY